ncbi:3-hydroxybutyryl-CoA dehydrogenase [Achromobacter sp. UMC46]|uniref:3-hydroxybutyryl-CoA dehydrogenase n=1 Tax=Achromobacter sp. UMC46 TaxID=1862319 RepID=UPI0015FFEAF6|nr:3-hydroxybutyryl-CoA dehydrogenase [Achromobacter sp. UMC46]MBB1593877.1 3-hydroxybutyryl-CoA dehydrogenase [Achromobacter sp. UMC46]
MLTMAPRICVAGAGRMGEGITLSYLLAGCDVTLVDIKPRPPAEQAEHSGRVAANLRRELGTLSRLGLLDVSQTEAALRRVRLCRREDAVADLRAARIVFEAVPERLDAKQDTFQWLGQACAPDGVIASTTSTFLVTDLAKLVPHPDRFLNAHWLNPAALIPLVEVSRGPKTSDAAVAELLAALRQAGKVPVQCAPSAGYIVPRIQALAMNEAARMVEEGVASAEDIDTAVRLGFGLRFSVLGLLEFIDWGGGDILYYASRYLSGEIGPRFASPDVIARNMEEGRNGLRDGQGFYDYAGMDVDAYKMERLGQLCKRLEVMGLLPRAGGASAAPGPDA